MSKMWFLLYLGLVTGNILAHDFNSIFDPAVSFPYLPSLAQRNAVILSDLANKAKDAEKSHIMDSDEDGIERPCKIYDKNCIRQFFSTHGKCKVVYGPLPDPLYRAQTTAYVPSLNVTLTGKDIFLYGFDGTIEEFYINRKTNRLVLAVQMPNLLLSSNKFTLRFNRRAKEPINRETFFNVTISSLSITIMIPNLEDLQLDKSEIFTFVDDPDPNVILDPTVFVSTEPSVVQTGVELPIVQPITSLEFFFLDANYYIISFIQLSICNFGLEVV